MEDQANRSKPTTTRRRGSGLNADYAQLDSRSAFRRWLQKPLRQRVRALVSVDFCGNDSPPLTERTLLRWDEHPDPESWNGEGYRVATFIDDGGEVGIGWHNKWDVIISRHEFHHIVIAYIKTRVVHDWCGLRTKLYFWTIRSKK